MLLWEMSALCEDRKGNGECMGCNYPPVEGRTRTTKHLGYWRPRTHHEIAAGAFVFHFFPGPSLSLKPMRQCRGGACRAQPGVVCDLHQVLEVMILLPGLISRAVPPSAQGKITTKAACVFTPLHGAEPLPCAVSGCSPVSCVHFRHSSGCPGSETFVFICAWKMCCPPSAGLCPLLQSLSRRVKTCF